MREFRFGFNVERALGPAELRDSCRIAEDFGYDVVLLPDHLGRDRPSPFVTMAAAAAASGRLRVGTLVLNTSLWNPSVLARDAAAVDLLSGGRLELGLGAGYNKPEFDAAGIPWRPFGERADRLEWTLDELDRLFAPDAADGYGTAQRPRPPLMLAGSSDRILRLAARRADIVSLTAVTPMTGKALGTYRYWTHDELAERVGFFRDQAGGRLDGIEANFLIPAVFVTDDPRAALGKLIADRGLESTVDDLLGAPAMFIGSVEEIAEQVVDFRDRYGVTYFCVFRPFMQDFGRVIEQLRG
jgi:probable F420-dependent oxidoreductase